MKSIHIDNLYLARKLPGDYRKVFDGICEKIVADSSLSDLDKSAAANVALEKCRKEAQAGVPASRAFPDDPSRYAVRFSGGPDLKAMKEQLCRQDYEKFVISSIWTVFTVSMVLLFLNNLITGRYLLTYWADAAIACIAGAVAMQNYRIRHRIVKRYDLGSLYLRLDLVTLGACIFIKLVSRSNFDITYLLLVISFFVSKRNASPRFQQLLSSYEKKQS